MKKLIVNADDLGLTNGVSLGIEESYLHGIVSSASLMANMPGFDEGVQVALRNPELGIGIHLNIIRGRPVSEEDTAYPLLNSDGSFFNNIFQIGRLSANQDYQKAAEIEYRLQIEKVLDSGVKPDHLDFEKHNGIWKPLYTIGMRLAREYGLAIRAYNEPLFFAVQKLPFAGYRSLWKSFHLKFYNTFFHRNLFVTMPNYFFGQTHIGNIDKNYLIALINNLPEGISELMTHPGHNLPTALNAEDIGNSWITEKREAEMNSLTNTDVITALKKSDIELTTFKEGLLNV